MQATRIIKTIEDTHVGELSSYIGQQVEIIIWPVEEKPITTADEDLERRERQFFQLLDRCSGTVKPWTREELYER